VIVDGGDLFWKSGALPEAERPERLLKARLIAEAFADVDALVPGEGDLSFGIDTYLELTEGLPVLAGNLTCGEHSWPLTRTLERGGRSVGLIGVVGAPGEGCDLSEEPAAAAARGIEELGEVDVVVLISHSQSAVDQAISREVPGIDFVLNGHARQTWPNPRALDGGGFHLGSGSRAKKLGWLEMTFVEGAEAWVDASGTALLEDDRARLLERLETAKGQVAASETPEDEERYQTRVAYYEGELERIRAEIIAAESTEAGRVNSFRNQLIPLDSKYEGHAAMDARVQETKEAITALAPKEYESTAPEGPFLGSQTCRGCHMEQYEQWSTTGHAHAYETLVKVTRHLEADCYSCHVTGAGMGGPSSAHDVGHLKNVGCESCHGPGQEHLADAAKGKIMNPPAKAICTGCHDGDQDGGRFVYEEYRPKVVH